MAKVTSKLQVTIPKVIARQYGIEPGAEVAFVEAGEAIRMIPGGGSVDVPDLERRLVLFDQATRRQTLRQRKRSRQRAEAPVTRGWTRADLYVRGRPS